MIVRNCLELSVYGSGTAIAFEMTMFDQDELGGDV